MRVLLFPILLPYCKSQGTGIGLHMTYNLIVDGMNGSIKAKNVHYQYNNRDYSGAEFTIIIPMY